MKKFVVKIVDIGHIPPHLKVTFDGFITDKDGVETWFRSLDCVRTANATLNDNIKLSACVYPIDESSMEEFQTYIEACLTKWISSTK